MKAAKDPLVVAVSLFRESLTRRSASGRRDIAQLDEGLARIETAIGQHAELFGRVGEPVVDLDRPLLPSPGVDRRKGELRDDLAALLRDTRGLRNALKPDAAVPIMAPDAVCLDSPEPERDLTGCFARARELAQRFADFTNDEVYFVQESITTDIGAGD